MPMGIRTGESKVFAIISLMSKKIPPKTTEYGITIALSKNTINLKAKAR